MKLCLEPCLTVVQSAYILLHYYNLGWTGLGCTRARRSFFLINSIIPLCSEGQPVLLEPRKGKGWRHEGAYALQKTTRSFHFIGPHPDSGGGGEDQNTAVASLLPSDSPESGAGGQAGLQHLPTQAELRKQDQLWRKPGTVTHSFTLSSKPISQEGDKVFLTLDLLPLIHPSFFRQ